MRPAIAMRRSFLLLLLLAQATFAELPGHNPKPGGIAVVDIGRHAGRPAAMYGERQALVMQDGDQWFAVVGLPLDATPGPAAVHVRGDRETAVDFEIVPHRYREQHLDVARRYVEPDEAQLERIFADRRVIDAALTAFRDVPVASVSLAPPVAGKRSPSFGFRRFFNGEARAPHSGMDITATSGTPISAPRAGIVAATGDFFFNGNTVILDHGQGFVTLYCHLQQIDVNEGDAVSAGDVLGLVGATGRVTGAHLHFGTYLTGTAVDPALILDPAP